MNNRDKMRGEFEAWYEGHCAPLESDWFKRDSDFPDDYDYFPAQEAWSGWQGFYETHVVDVPEGINGEYYADGYNSAIDAIYTVLEEAGVKYK